jgi:uncharacterized tellurite resistance protein B-like protein|tara:strand:- start:104 stop:526 length:423 start_codon:yes stop_codon:yes gene_type:complete
MFKFLKNDKKLNQANETAISLASLLIHAAKIDENYSENEKKIIKQTLLNLGSRDDEINHIMEKAELAEKSSNQILEFTKKAKNLKEDYKLILIEALWTIIYSDQKADMYEANLMRRLSGLLYLDNKTVGDIKEKIKNKSS